MATLDSQAFQNNIRDVNELFDPLLSEFPVLLRLMLQGSTNDLIDAGVLAPGTAPTILSTFLGGDVKNAKYEWIDDQLKATQTDITGFVTDGDGTQFDVTSSDGFQVGMLSRIESSVGASKSEIIKVTAIDSPTRITIERDYAGTTGVTLVIGDFFKVTSQPKEENSLPGSGKTHEGIIKFNFTEIFDEVAEVSRTAQQTWNYAQDTRIERQMAVALTKLARKLSGAIYHGIRFQDAGDNDKRTMGGLLSFINGNIESSGGAISQTMLDNVFEDIAADGGMSDNYLIVGHPTQTRKISALNTGGTNPVVFKQDEVGQRLGNFVSNYVSDLPLLDGAMRAGILSDWDMVKDEVLVLDLDKIRMKTMKGIGLMNAAQNGQDGFKERVLTETTLEIKNAGEAHGKITGLSL